MQQFLLGQLLKFGQIIVHLGIIPIIYYYLLSKLLWNIFAEKLRKFWNDLTKSLTEDILEHLSRQWFHKIINQRISQTLSLKYILEYFEIIFFSMNVIRNSSWTHPSWIFFPIFFLIGFCQESIKFLFNTARSFHKSLI